MCEAQLRHGKTASANLGTFHNRVDDGQTGNCPNVQVSTWNGHNVFMAAVFGLWIQTD
jgi:hypothetical protein